MPTRDEYRTKIMGSQKAVPQKAVITFMDMDIELRQPTLGSIINSRQEAEEQPETSTILGLIDNAYIPGTDDKIFTIEDVDWFKSLPVAGDLGALLEKMSELSTINLNTQDGSSEQNLGGSGSTESATS